MQTVSEQKPCGQRNCIHSSGSGLLQGTDLGKATKQFLLHWRYPTEQWPLIIKWQRFGTTRTLLGAEQSGKMGFIKEGDQKSSGHSDWADFSVLTCHWNSVRHNYVISHMTNRLLLAKVYWSTFFSFTVISLTITKHVNPFKRKTTFAN